MATKSLKDIGSPGKLLAQLTTGGFVPFAEGVRRRVMRVSFAVLERMADRNPIANAIVNKRCQQVRPFCRVSTDPAERGFSIQPKSGLTPKMKEGKKPRRIVELEDFVMNTGFAYEPDREDDFPDFAQMLVRDVLTFDQNATELRRTNAGKVFDYWYIDPTTIARAVPIGGGQVHHPSPAPVGGKGAASATLRSWMERARGPKGRDVRFVQRELQNNRTKITATFTAENMIFDYMYKRSRQQYRGYGYSPLEQCIDTVTTLLFGLTYNKDLFIRERLPKGFLKVMGDVDAATLRAVKNAWVAEMTGYGAKFRVPIIPSGKEGVGIDWQALGQSNRDMEYTKLLHLIISIMCAVFTIDPIEIGIKTDLAPQGLGHSGTKPKIEESKDTGLGALLMYIETYMNKILHKVDEDVVFKFTGVKEGDAKKKAELREMQIKQSRSVDDFRRADGLEPYEELWSSIPLRPEIVQLVQAEKQEQQMAAMGGGAQPGGGEEPADEGGDGGEGGRFSWEVGEGDAELEGGAAEKSLASLEDALFKGGPLEVVI